VVAAPPCGDGQAYTSLLDLTLLTGATLVAAPLPLVTAAMRVYKGTAAIVPRGTHVPGVPPDRVFPVALSPIAAPRSLAAWSWRRAKLVLQPLDLARPLPELRISRAFPDPGASGSCLDM
jgi:hypothetical protein